MENSITVPLISDESVIFVDPEERGSQSLRDMQKLSGLTQISVAMDAGIEYKTYHGSVSGGSVLSAHKIQLVMLRLAWIMRLTHDDHGQIMMLPLQGKELVVHLVKLHGIDKKTIAEKSNMARSSMTNCSTGFRDFSWKGLQRIAAAMDWKLELVKGTPEKCTWPVDALSVDDGNYQHVRKSGLRSRQRYADADKQALSDGLNLSERATNALSLAINYADYAIDGKVIITAELSAVLGKISQIITLYSATFWINQNRLDWIAHKGCASEGYCLDIADAMLFCDALKQKKIQLRNQLLSFGG